MAATDSDGSLGSAGESDAKHAVELEPVKNGVHGTGALKAEVLSKGKPKDESDEEGEASDDGEIDTSKEKTEGEEGELEEGEVDDDEEGGGQQKNSVCKYFYKGQCTWGSHCRFIHPGSVDKGNYSLFDAPASKNPPPEPVHAKPSGPPLMVPQPGQRPMIPARRRNSPQLIPPVLPLRMPLPHGLPPRMPMDFFPPIPEPPRPETMWERGLRQAKTLAQAAARKRDAIEDKMHGLNEKFDPEFEDEHFGESEFPFPEQQQQRGFPPFPMRQDFEQMRNRRMNDFPRFDRRRSPPIDNRENMMDRRPREPMMRQRGADEWHDPWMRSAGGGGRNRPQQQQRWNNRNRSKSGSQSKSRSRSGSPSQKKSRTSRSNSKEKLTRKRSGSASSSTRARQRERDRRNATRQRTPSGSPISSSHSSLSRSSSRKSPAAPQNQKPSRANSHVSDPRARLSVGSRLSQQERASSRKHHQADDRNKTSPSLSSVSSRNHEEDDGPRTPPPDPDEADEESVKEEARSEEREMERPRTSRSRSKRSPSQSPISDEENDGRRQGSSVNEEQPVKKKMKKGHKPVKLTLGNKTERRAANAAFGPTEEEMEEEEAAMQLNIKPNRQASMGERDQDPSSPLSEAEEDPSAKRAPVVVATGSEEKHSKREELLRQLRAVEEAIARKKATKVAD